LRALYPPLRRFAAVVGPIKIDPDDLVQEALVRALARQPLSELGDAGAYLRTVIVRLASNDRRSLGRRRLAFSRLESVDVAEGISVYPSDLADLYRVSAEDRAVLWLTAVEGVGVAAVATMLGCSERAVRMRKHRALRRLRRALQEDADVGH